MIINWKEKTPFTLMISFITFVINKRRLNENKVRVLSIIVCVSTFLITYIFYKEQE